MIKIDGFKEYADRGQLEATTMVTVTYMRRMMNLYQSGVCVAQLR